METQLSTEWLQKGAYATYFKKYLIIKPLVTLVSMLTFVTLFFNFAHIAANYNFLGVQAIMNTTSSDGKDFLLVMGIFLLIGCLSAVPPFIVGSILARWHRKRISNKLAWQTKYLENLSEELTNAEKNLSSRLKEIEDTAEKEILVIQEKAAEQTKAAEQNIATLKEQVQAAQELLDEEYKI